MKLYIVLGALALTVSSNALTTEKTVSAAKRLRDNLQGRSPDWNHALKTWTCPTDPDSSDQECDICSSNWSGNWEHLHCRGFSGVSGFPDTNLDGMVHPVERESKKLQEVKKRGAACLRNLQYPGSVIDLNLDFPYGEGSVGEKDGLITTVHITDVNLDGPVPQDFCRLEYLREFDLDGGQLTGPFPKWLMQPYPPGAPDTNDTQCMRNLQELDLSHNMLTGTIPWEINRKAKLQEFKVESNFLRGSLPGSFADLKEIWRIRVAGNKLSGSIPDQWRSLAGRLNELWLNGNNFEGSLEVLGAMKGTVVKVHNNPKLCGMVPAGIRYAHGYNPGGTRLGLPC